MLCHQLGHFTCAEHPKSQSDSNFAELDFRLGSSPVCHGVGPVETADPRLRLQQAPVLQGGSHCYHSQCAGQLAD